MPARSLLTTAYHGRRHGGTIFMLPNPRRSGRVVQHWLAHRIAEMDQIPAPGLLPEILQTRRQPWVTGRNGSTDQRPNARPKTSTNESDAKTPSDVPLEPPVLTFEALSFSNSGRNFLIQCFAECGGYIWRHEDQTSRWYFVGEKLTLEHRIRHPRDAPHPDVQKMRIIGKRWIPKNFLIEAGHEYTE